jgi:integrase
MPKRKRLSKRGHGEGTAFQRSDGRWQGAVTIGFTPEGKQRRKTVYAASQAEVLQKIETIKREMATGLFTDVKLTVSEYMQRWLSEKEKHVKLRTITDYRYDTEKFIDPLIGKVKIEKLMPLQIQNFLNEVEGLMSADRANRVRRTLYAALKQAVRWLLIPRNPVEATTRMNHTPKQMQMWTPQGTVKFLAEARTNRMYALFYLALSAGLRSGELLALKWSDLQGNKLVIQHSLGYIKGEIIISSPKTEKSIRRVTLAPDVLEVLEQHHIHQEAERAQQGKAWSDLGIVFSKQDGGYITPRRLATYWYDLLESAKVPHIRLHDLRHMNVSIRRKMGQDAKQIADQVGHADPAFTMRLYTHLFQDDREEAAVNLSDWLPKGNPETNN